MAKIARKTKRYPSDLTDEEWAQIAPLMPKPGRRGRPREVEFREVINAVRYLVRSGGGWRMLPVHFGPWQTVYGWFRELARRFLFQTTASVRALDRLAKAGSDRSAPLPQASSVRPGTLLVRDWDGVLHRVTTLDDGFAWNGTSYRSLSEVARAITGTRWNGPRFFGLREGA